MFTNKAKKTLSFIKSNKKLFLAVVSLLIIFLSLFPRSIDVLNQNPIFGFDQGREMLAAKNIVINHKPILIGAELGAGSAGISGIFQGPVYYYLLTIPFVLFNGNPVGGVLLMLIFSLASVVFGYYFGKKLFGNTGGIFLSLLLSISPILISQGRFMWSPHLVTLFILLSFYFIYCLRKRNLNVFLASFFAGFVYNFEFAIAAPLSIAVFFYSIFIFRKKLIKYLYLFLGFFIGYLPMFFFEIRHGFMGLKGLISYLTSNNHTSGLSNSSFVLDHTKSFIHSFKETFPVNDFNFSIIFFIVLIIFSIFLLNKEKNINFKYFFSFLIFLIPVNFFIFYFLKNTVWNYYLTDLSLSYILLLTYVIYSLYSRKYYRLSILSFVFIGVFVVLAISNAIKVSIYDYSDYGGTAKIKGKIDAIDYIYKDAKNMSFGVLTFSPPIYTYPYDYLLWWHGERKYNYIPYQDKKGTFYLLIEPDGQKPWTYKGWLETVIKTGKVEWTKTLPSGFIVQKRAVD